MNTILLTLALSQFFGPPTCKQGQDCTVNSLTTTVFTSDAGSVNSVKFSPQQAFPLCQVNTPIGAVANYSLNGAGNIGYSQLVVCDYAGFEQGIQAFQYVAAPRTKIGSISTSTISSGVITTGNILLGGAELMPASSKNDGGTYYNIIDNINVQCNTAGTGAGNMVTNLRKIRGNGGAATVCSANFPCATASLVSVPLTCTGILTGVIGDFSDGKYGTTLDVSGCTTPPADCVIVHDVHTN